MGDVQRAMQPATRGARWGETGSASRKWSYMVKYDTVAGSAITLRCTVGQLLALPQ